jgi:serine/threonine protein phosphatase PrpC
MYPGSVAGRASIVGAAETNVGKVRDHNEDSHFIDPELGIFLVCDGMGGHAAGEVASALAVQTIRERWGSDATQAIADRWLGGGTPEARRALMSAIDDGVKAAHEAILQEAQRDRSKGGMGTTLVGAMNIGGDFVFAHCGDSRAYLVRDGIAMQLTEDHTLLARLLAAGVDVDVEGDGSRFKSMLTNALGIGDEVKVASFVVPIADGDRFLLCSDGITEYVQEAEIGEVLCKMPSPARAAQKLVELALERGGGDNATALVVRVLEAGETSRPSELIQKEEKAIHSCALWAKVTPQQRLRALRIALPRDYVAGERIPAHALGDRVAWILVEGEVDQDAELRGPGSLLYPESLLADRPLPDKEALAVTRGEVRMLALRSDDFRELCEDDPDLGETLLEALAGELSARRPTRRTGRVVVQFDADSRGNTDPGETAKKEVEAAAEPAPPLPPIPEPPARRGDTLPPPPPRAPSVPPTDTSIEKPFGRAPSVPPMDKPAASEAMPIARITPRRLPSHPGGLFVSKEDRPATEAALDDALAKITLDDGWAQLPDEATPKPAPPPAPPPSEDEPDVIIVEADAPDVPPVRELSRPSGPRLGDHSDAEISIEAIDDSEPEPTEEPQPDDHEEMVVSHEDDKLGSARVVEVIKDTSSQTITMTSDEPSEPEIVVIREK